MYAFLMIASAMLQTAGINANVYCGNGAECHLEIDDLSYVQPEYQIVSQVNKPDMTVITLKETVIEGTAPSRVYNAPLTTIHGTVPSTVKSPKLVNCGAWRDIGGNSVRSCETK